MESENKNSGILAKVFNIFMGVAFLGILIYYLVGFIYGLTTLIDW